MAVSRRDGRCDDVIERGTTRKACPDNAQAVTWFRLAADRGNALAQYNLGVMYRDGQGVPQDDVEAHKWFNLAASRVSVDRMLYTEAARDALAERMSAEQIADAQERARVWQQAEQKTP